MRKLLKILASIVVVLIILIIVAIVLISLFVKPSNFKPIIEKQVTEMTGRQFTIGGNLEWTFFPHVGIKVDHVMLANPLGFPMDKPFVEIVSATFSIRLMPLLHKEIIANRITIDGFTLNLMEKKDGHNNWQELQAKFAGNKLVSPVTPQPPSTMVPSETRHLFNLPEVDFHNGSINWQDEATGQSISITNWQFSATDMGIQHVFPINTTFTINDKASRDNGKVSFASQIYLDPQNAQYQLSNFTLKVITLCPSGAALPIILTGDVKANLRNQLLTVAPIQLQIASLAANGQLYVKNLQQNPTMSGSLQVAQFNLGHWLGEMGVGERKELKGASVSLELAGAADNLALTAIQATIGKTHIKGNVQITSFKNKQASLNLDVDRLDLNDYMLSPSPSATSTVVNITPSLPTTYQATLIGAQSGSAVPMETHQAVYNWQVNGEYHVDELIYQQYDIHHLDIKSTLQQGILTLNPLNATLYGGSLLANANINLLHGPIYVIAGDLQGVQVADLLRAMQQTKVKVEGVAHAHFQVTTEGTGQTIVQSLNGNGNIAIHNGVIHGIDIPHILDSIDKLVHRQASAPAANDNSVEGQTNFTALTGTLAIDHGVMTNNDLLLDQDRFQMKGQGIINLVQSTINYGLNVIIKPHGEEKQSGGQLFGITIPIRMMGDFDRLRVRVDMQSLLEQAAKQQVIDTVKDQIKKKIGDKMGDKTGQLLNGILGQ